jgi:hypothetical protein
VFLVLRKKVVHGAVTNGHQWFFILVKINDNYEGASFRYSVPIQIGGYLYDHGIPNKSWPDLIAAILLHWVCLFSMGMNLIPLLHRPKALWTILDGDTRRATAHITNLRRDAFASTVRREHGLLALEFIERLFSNNRSMSADQRSGNSSTVTRLGFTSISETETVSEEKRSEWEGQRRSHAQSRGATTLRSTGHSSPIH